MSHACRSHVAASLTAPALLCVATLGLTSCIGPQSKNPPPPPAGGVGSSQQGLAAGPDSSGSPESTGGSPESTGGGDDGGWHTWSAGLQGGYTTVDSESGDVSGNTVDEEDTGFGVWVAYRPIRYASVELGYQDLGKEKYTDRSTPPFVFKGDVATSGFQASVLGHYPIWGPIEALGRIGAFVYETEDKGDTIAGGGGSYNEKDDGTEFVYGLGAEVSAWGPVSVRLEYQHIDGIKFDNFWLSVLWGF